MIRNFDDLMALAKNKEPRILSVAVAQDEDVLTAVKIATDEGIVKPILVGDEKKIREITDAMGWTVSPDRIIHIEDVTEACAVAVKQVTEGKADILMKGLVDTSIILKAVLNKEANLRTGNVLSHVGVLDIPTYERLLLVTDAAMNIAPDLETKKQIIQNAVTVAHSMSIEIPKVAVICAKEKVNPKMQATVDAEALVDMYNKDDITGCIVGGPFALDNAVSPEAAKLKGIQHPVAGYADVLMVPTIESGNILYKALAFLGGAEAAGLLVGAKVPIIVTSRADSEKSKLNSIALAMLMASPNTCSISCD
ncbi:phosphate butyryltransferase [Vallitalea pronyensis]|uniref:Phosphate butyryltransferase n=1 Tax=Vallitalea pronyensis TaxID=1348613 RepID=A0A8J8SGZ4_9FIRM|nr:phosphate butyryltransferase [Vallitalea pronyensis]QUI23081.1 phosphate butyryltransferase [Vallitalea pronyensis]